MNQIRYVAFHPLLILKASSKGVKRETGEKYLYAGMWPLTVAVKEGFAGVRRLREESSDEVELETRKAVNQVLQNNTIVNPRDEEYLEELRALVRSEAKGIFHH